MYNVWRQIGTIASCVRRRHRRCFAALHIQNVTHAMHLREVITMSTCVRWTYRQPDVHACPHTLTSALAKKTTSALIARAALRVSLISIPPPRSSACIAQKLYQSVTFIWRNYYVDMRSLNISPTGRACMSPHVHDCSDNKDDFRAYCQSSSADLCYLSFPATIV